MSKNFIFFRQELPTIDEFGTRAEDYLGRDDRSSAFNSGLILEELVNNAFKHLKIRPPSKLHDKIHTLKKNKCISGDYAKLLSLDKMKELRNEAAHPKGRVTFDDALWMLLSAFVLAKWSYAAFYDKIYDKEFIIPFAQKKFFAKMGQSTEKLLDGVDGCRLLGRSGFSVPPPLPLAFSSIALAGVAGAATAAFAFGGILSGCTMIHRAFRAAEVFPIPRVLLDYAENS